MDRKFPSRDWLKRDGGPNLDSLNPTNGRFNDFEDEFGDRWETDSGCFESANDSVDSSQFIEDEDEKKEEEDKEEDDEEYDPGFVRLFGTWD